MIYYSTTTAVIHNIVYYYATTAVIHTMIYNYTGLYMYNCGYRYYNGRRARLR